MRRVASPPPVEATHAQARGGWEDPSGTEGGSKAAPRPPRRGAILGLAAAGGVTLLLSLAWIFRDSLPAPLREPLEAVAIRLAGAPPVPTATPELPPPPSTPLQ